MWNVFISYSAKDRDLYFQLKNQLEHSNFSVYDPSAMTPGANFVAQLTTAISQSEIFIALVTEQSLQSQYVFSEISFALTKAADRRKIIIPAIDRRCTTLPARVQFHLAQYQYYYIDTTSPEDVKNSFDRIVAALTALTDSKSEEERLLEKLQSYLSMRDARLEASSVLCELIEHTCNKLNSLSVSAPDPGALRKLFIYLDKLLESYDYTYNAEASKVAHQKLDCLNTAIKTLDYIADLLPEPVSSAVKIIRIYYDREIRYTCADAITRGDVSDHTVKTLSVDDFKEAQAPYITIYYSYFNNQNPSAEALSAYSDFESLLLEQAPRYMYSKINVPGKWDDVSVNSQWDSSGADSKNTETAEEKSLKQIAKFLADGTKLFDTLASEISTDAFLRCLQMCYDRLEKYCGIVGESEVRKQCIEKKYEIREKLETPLAAGAPVKAEESIRALLGLSIPSTGNYDVFLSHKSSDDDIAEQVYSMLTANLKNVFFDKKSIPELSESQYRKTIMQSLDRSKHFIVIFSDLKYIESGWVAQEMEVFSGEMLEGRKPGSNFILIVTPDVYKQIIDSNKSVLPIEYRKFEILKLDDFEKTILQFLS